MACSFLVSTLFLGFGLPVVLFALIVASSCALEKKVKHLAQFVGLLPHLTMLFLDRLHVVVKAENLREFWVLLNFFNHLLGQT